MTLLIIIPALNEGAHIAAVLESLTAQAPPDARIVVADGGSTDDTPAIAARFPRVTLMPNPGRLQSAGINRAVEHHGDGCTLLLRADAHAAYPPDFIATLLSELSHTGVASITVPMRTLGPTPFAKAVAAAQNSLLGTGGSAHRTGAGGRFVDHGHHALMRLDAFRAVGGYDPTQSHNEDAELDHRLRAAGHTIWLTGRTHLGYVPRGSFAALFRQYLKHGRGRAATTRKHRLRLKPRQMAPLLVPPALGLAALGAALSFLHPLWMVLAVPALAWATICLAYGALLALGQHSLPVVLSGPAAMTMHLAWALGYLTGPRHPQ